MGAIFKGVHQGNVYQSMHNVTMSATEQDLWSEALLQVMPLGDLSARTQAGSRCFKRMLFCNLPGLWKQPFDQNWTAGLQPSLVGQKVRCNATR